MISNLSFQEKCKDKLTTIGNDDISGIVKQSELPVYKIKQETINSLKDINRDKVNFKNSPVQFTKLNLFEIKEKPIKNKSNDRNTKKEEKKLSLFYKYLLMKTKIISSFLIYNHISYKYNLIIRLSSKIKSLSYYYTKIVIGFRMLYNIINWVLSEVTIMLTNRFL